MGHTWPDGFADEIHLTMIPPSEGSGSIEETGPEPLAGEPLAPAPEPTAPRPTARRPRAGRAADSRPPVVAQPVGLGPAAGLAGRARRQRGRQASRRGVLAFILAVAIAFSAGVTIGFSAAPTTGGALGLPQANPSFPPQFAVYEQAWQILQQNYVDPKALDPTTLTYGSISGLLSAVGDTDHTRFLSPQDLANENSLAERIRWSGSAPR